MAIDSLPESPMMLLSFVNTRLRDDRIDLLSFCSQFGVTTDEIEEKLKAIDYTYDKTLNRFI